MPSNPSPSISSLSSRYTDYENIIDDWDEEEEVETLSTEEMDTQKIHLGQNRQKTLSTRSRKG